MMYAGSRNNLAKECELNKVIFFPGISHFLEIPRERYFNGCLNFSPTLIEYKFPVEIRI